MVRYRMVWYGIVLDAWGVFVVCGVFVVRIVWLGLGGVGPKGVTEVAQVAQVAQM